METLLNKLEDAHRVREDFIKTNTALTNQIKAIKRKHGKDRLTEDELAGIYFYFDNSKKEISQPLKLYTKQLDKLAKQLPQHDWITQFVGIDSKSYGMIIAETGDLRNYPNPAKVWKRMGLAVRDGSAEKNHTKGMNTGYSKGRRSVMYRVVNPIIQHKAKNCRYTDLFTYRKSYEIDRNESGCNKEYVEKNQQKLLYQFTSKANQEKIKSGKLPDGVLHLRAHRYVGKRILRDLWERWNGM